MGANFFKTGPFWGTSSETRNTEEPAPWDMKLERTLIDCTAIMDMHVSGLDKKKSFNTVAKSLSFVQFLLKITTNFYKGAKFAKTIPLRVQNVLSGPTLKGAKSLKNRQI